MDSYNFDPRARAVDEEHWLTTPYSYGYLPTTDYYGRYLSDLIDANPENPTFQKGVLENLVEYMNPYNRQKRALEQQENMLNTALSLLFSKDANIQGYGLNMVRSVYPEYTGEVEQPKQKSYYDLRRESARQDLAKYGTNKKDYDFYSWLSTAPDDEIAKYDRLKGLMNIAPEFRGTSVNNPFSPAFWSPEARAREALGFR